MYDYDSLPKIEELKIPDRKNAKKLAHSIFEISAKAGHLSSLVDCLVIAGDADDPIAIRELPSALRVTAENLDDLYRLISELENRVNQANGLIGTYFPGWEKELEDNKECES